MGPGFYQPQGGELWPLFMEKEKEGGHVLMCRGAAGVFLVFVTGAFRVRGGGEGSDETKIVRNDDTGPLVRVRKRRCSQREGGRGRRKKTSAHSQPPEIYPLQLEHELWKVLHLQYTAAEEGGGGKRRRL